MGRLPVVLLLLWLVSEVILPSPFSLCLLFLFFHHPLLSIDVLVNIDEELREVIGKLL